MRILIAGSEGQMGDAAVWAAEQLFGRENVYRCDLKDVCKRGASYFRVDGDSYNSILDLVRPTIVLSCMPYFANSKLAKECILKRIFYADLGGSVPVSKEINSLAGKYKSFVMTDLGLAPGLVNIVAWNLFKKQDFDSCSRIELMCGGLPVDRYCGRLKYKSNWSVDGLINEYYDECLTRENGELVIKRGMSDFSTLSFGNENYECFNTSGGLAHSLIDFSPRQAPNLSYKTIRYAGHLAELHQMSKEDAIKDMTDEGWYEDIVLVKVNIYKKNFFTTEEITVRHSDRFTAMQRATAFSAISAVNSAKPPGMYSCTYSDIDYNKYMTQFNQLIETDNNGK
jgi:saccharopine dehydrogenase-like NADP-dependent oxidoreductase